MIAITDALAINIAAVPAELRAHPQWVLWRFEKRQGKTTKVPINPRTSRRADTTDPTTWATFEEVVPLAGERGLGIGFVFSPDDQFAGVDLDDCRDPLTGAIAAWATAIVSDLRSYTEVSPSGTGLKIFVRGDLPPGGNRKGAIELYDRARFFTVTGRHLSGTPVTVEGRQAALHGLHERIFGRPACDQPLPPIHGTTPVSCTRSDAEIIARAKAAKNGAKFARLLAGDVTGYSSRSEADAALCALLAFYARGDLAAVDRLFRQSGLYREKWEREDYRRATLQLARDLCASWTPGGRGARPGPFEYRRGRVVQ